MQPLQRNNSCSKLFDIESSFKEKSFKEQLEKEEKKTQIIQTAYWSLRSDYQNVCRALKAAKKANAAEPKDEWMERLKEKEKDWSQKSMAKNAELANLRQKNAEMCLEMKAMRKNNQQSITALKQKNKEVNKKNNTLEMYIKNLKMSIKKVERENKRLAQSRSMKKDILSELYLSSGRIKHFMVAIQDYGIQIQTLRKRQLNLTASVGRESEEEVMSQMNELYCDVVKAEECYNGIYQSLDAMKNESETKELEVMTKNKEYIALLEKEKFVQSSHLEEYVKENQKLQLDLRDREMKLRQTQSKFNRIKQRLNRLQNENDNLCDQLNQMEVGSPNGHQMMDQAMGPPQGGHPHHQQGGQQQWMQHGGQFVHNPYFNGICAQ